MTISGDNGHDLTGEPSSFAAADPPAKPKRHQKASNLRPKFWQPKFIKALSKFGVFGMACKAANIHHSTAYKYRDLSPKFAKQWQEALDESLGKIEREIYRRAVEGLDKPVYQSGKKCGDIREYSDTLLIFLAKARAPHIYRDNPVASVQVQNTVCNASISSEAAAALKSIGDQNRAIVAEFKQKLIRNQ